MLDIAGSRVPLFCLWRRWLNLGVPFHSAPLLRHGNRQVGPRRALHQNSGEVLWEVDLGSAVTGHPITYAVDGKQYVAVSTGISVVTEGTNNLTPELSPGVDNTLFVFALP